MNAQMEAHMNEEERQSAQQAGEPSESALADQPLTCHLCQRPAVLEVHTTGHTVYGLDACREPTDSGVWVCGSCHRALHRWMDRNPGEEAAMLAIAEVMNHALEVIQTPRTYRRRHDMRSSPTS